MKTELPAEQDKLLKEFHDIEQEERAEIIPERNKINLALIIITSIISGFIIVIDILTDQISFAIGVGVCGSAMIATLVLTMRNIKIGFYLSCIAAISVNAYVTYLHYLSPGLYVDFSTILDGLMILILSNQFSKKGYYVGAVLVFAKLVFAYTFIPYSITIIGVVIAYMNALIIGRIPILIISIAIAYRIARKEKIRAEILSLQNQDLLKNWEYFYKPEDKNQSAAEVAGATSIGVS